MRLERFDRGDDDEEVALGQEELAVVGIAEPLGRIDDLVENRLQPFRASHCPEHAAQRALLGPQVLHLACEISSVVGRRPHPR